MRCRSAAQSFVLFVSSALLVTPGLAQVHAFRETPARPATAAGQMAARPQPAPESPEARAERVFDQARNHDGALYAFLREMPKGADLHNHDVGSVYAESWIRWAAQSGLCVDKQSLALSKPTCLSGQTEASNALKDPVLYREMLDAYSMRGATRNGMPGTSFTGHDHFFDTFFKFFAAAEGHMGQVYAEVSTHAADSHVQYVELMSSPDNGAAIGLGTKLQWDDSKTEAENFALMRTALEQNGLDKAVADARRNLDAWEAERDSVLGCQAPNPSKRHAGCAVKVRYIYPVLRAFPREQVFAQMALAFELAKQDHRVVAVNMVQAEDWQMPMRDFRRHMAMMDSFKQLYPQVHVTLHAGELAPGIVPPEGLRFHIRESIERGHAERIGHGVDVMYENDPQELLALMAHRGILVEVCLTSNDGILGVRGKQHPLAAYLKAGVPVALATDDEGVSRSEMTREYLRAVRDQQLDYPALKRLARNSLEYSFLPGGSLFSDPRRYTLGHDCNLAGAPSANCKAFLASSEKAHEQWKMEKAFLEFENHLREEPKRD